MALTIGKSTRAVVSGILQGNVRDAFLRARIMDSERPNQNAEKEILRLSTAKARELLDVATNPTYIRFLVEKISEDGPDEMVKILEDTKISNPDIQREAARCMHDHFIKKNICDVSVAETAIGILFEEEHLCTESRDILASIIAAAVPQFDYVAELIPQLLTRGHKLSEYAENMLVSIIDSGSDHHYVLITEGRLNSRQALNSCAEKIAKAHTAERSYELLTMNGLDLDESVRQKLARKVFNEGSTEQCVEIARQVDPKTTLLIR